MTGYGVAAFASAHGAIRAEKHLAGRFSIAVMPTPRAVTASCGISLRFALPDAEGVRAALEELSGERGRWALYRIGPGGEASPLGAP